ncbi:hypothetical protein D910_08907, partial [Dendroctonus ponderosae]
MERNKTESLYLDGCNSATPLVRYHQFRIEFRSNSICARRCGRLPASSFSSQVVHKSYSCLVSKMDSDPNVQDYESRAKRLKLEFEDPDIGGLCDNLGFPRFSHAATASIDSGEGTTDCDSGYEPSTLQSLPTSPNSLNTSPFTNSGEMTDNMPNLYQPYPPILSNNTDNSHLDMAQEEEEDDDASVGSELSGLSNTSGQQWKPMAGSFAWIQKQIQKGTSPKTILTELGVDLEQIPQCVGDFTLWNIIINMLADPPRRSKLRHVNTLDDVVRLLKVLTGAGVSVSCGIPDFRSRDGIYSRLAIEFPNLPNPQAMFDINYFSQDPRPFFKFAKDIYPGKFKPSPCHRFIKLLEKHNKLLRNYTQNIDTLEKEASIERVIECHGSFATATCTKCEHKVGADKIRNIVLSQKIPMCEKCHGDTDVSVSTDDFGSDATNYKDLVQSGIMKPDIVFFGEGLPDTFHDAMASDKTEGDLLVVIGSSLKVRPVALIPNSLPAHVPQILINREPLSHCHFDVELLGDCDVIINHLCKIKWQENAETISKFECTGKPVVSVTEEVHRCTCESTRMNYTNSNNNPGSSGQETICSCQTDGKSTKERHISIDSALDSGIGENSNFTDLETESGKEGSSNFATDLSSESSSCNVKGSETCLNEKSNDMRSYWQPKAKRSLAERLPPNSYHLVAPSRYIFPGAEVYYDPDEKSSSSDDEDSSSDT